MYAFQQSCYEARERIQRRRSEAEAERMIRHSRGGRRPRLQGAIGSILRIRRPALRPGL